MAGKQFNVRVQDEAYERLIQGAKSKGQDMGAYLERIFFEHSLINSNFPSAMYEAVKKQHKVIEEIVQKETATRSELTVTEPISAWDVEETTAMMLRPAEEKYQEMHRDLPALKQDWRGPEKWLEQQVKEFLQRWLNDIGSGSRTYSKTNK